MSKRRHNIKGREVHNVIVDNTETKKVRGLTFIHLHTESTYGVISKTNVLNQIKKSSEFSTHR